MIPAHQIRTQTRLALLFPNLGLLADLATQIVKLGAADIADAQNLYLAYLGGMYRERPLDADAEGMLANGERLTRAFALPLEDYALKNLDTAAGPFNNLEVHLDSVSGFELRDTLA